MERDKMNGLALIQLFDKAAAELKSPKLKWMHPDHPDWLLRFTRATGGRNPGGVHVATGEMYVGTFDRQGEFRWSYPMSRSPHQPILGKLLKTFLANPIEQAKISGQKYNFCCFCGLTLTNASSVYHGYGPICAGNWGLPWGDVPEKDDKYELGVTL
jgi:hypothetical protein